MWHYSHCRHLQPLTLFGPVSIAVPALLRWQHLPNHLSWKRKYKLSCLHERTLLPFVFPVQQYGIVLRYVYLQYHWLKEVNLQDELNVPTVYS